VLSPAGLSGRIYRRTAYLSEFFLSRSWRPNAFTTRIDSSPCWTTATMLLAAFAPRECLLTTF